MTIPPIKRYLHAQQIGVWVYVSEAARVELSVNGMTQDIRRAVMAGPVTWQVTVGPAVGGPIPLKVRAWTENGKRAGQEWIG